MLEINVFPHQPNGLTHLIHFYVTLGGDLEDVERASELDYFWTTKDNSLAYEGRWSPRIAEDYLTHYNDMDELKNDLLLNSAWKSSPDYTGDDWEYHHKDSPVDAMFKSIKILVDELKNIGINTEVNFEWVDFCPVMK